MAQQYDLNVGRIALTGLVSVIATVAIILFLQVLFYSFQRRQLATPQFDQGPAETANYVADQQGKLVSYAVVDKDRKVVTIPIKLAEQLVIDALTADPGADVTGVADPQPLQPAAEKNETGGTGDRQGAEPRQEETTAPPGQSSPPTGAGDQKAKEANDGASS